MPDSKNRNFVQVAVATPLRNFFTYSVPKSLAGELRSGQLVEVPFGKKMCRGIIYEFCDRPEAGKFSIKPIAQIVEHEPVCNSAMLRTLKWASDYYLTPPGEMIFAALPPRFRKRGAANGIKATLTASLERKLEVDQIAEIKKRAPLQAKLLESLNQEIRVDVSSLAFLGSSVRQALHALEQKGLVRLERETRRREPESPDLPLPDEVVSLNPQQTQALACLTGALEKDEYAAFLLHGVTGSGKTEVYLRAIDHALALGKDAILLVPEISLTPQLLSRVTGRFGRLVAVLHSGLSQGERLDEWRRLQRHQARVAVGARSAVFAPVRKLGILVIDEEHDSSYKQSERLVYNGRDLGMVRALQEQACVLLGTATPSVESYSNASKGRSKLIVLPQRVQQRALPQIEIVDLKKELPDPIERGHTVGSVLADALAKTLDRGEQAILFLNRRGYSSFALCKDCGQSIRCTNCSVALVHHRAEQRLKCHYCGLNIALPKKCPSCESGRIQMFGLGTQKCEEEVLRRFPGVRLIRLDSDSTSRRGALHKMLSKFAKREADVLIGTQMVTKGHDMPGVTLVGVLLADLSLHFPDFRAGERTFQLLVQVAGRAGRGDKPGRVVIQTLLPEHESIVLATRYDLEEFYRQELNRREGLGYPPFRRLLLVRVAHPNKQTASELAQRVAKSFQAESRGQIQLLGPVVSPLAKIRGRYRYQMLVKSPTVEALHQVALIVQRRIRAPKDAKILFDVDPVDML
ncbi:MAG: primosomal protein N' [Deltaproteobacteria bacterium]|nr:primosomal protein N' [Deltaproteobacteria bacterium]